MRNHDLEVLFIDGPWDGRRMMLEETVLMQPSYVVAVMEPVDASPYDPYAPLPAPTRFHYNFMKARGSLDRRNPMYFAYPSAWRRKYPNPTDHVFAALFHSYVGNGR